MIQRRWDPVAVAGVSAAAPLLADHANFGHASRRRPGRARPHRLRKSTRTSLTSARKTNGPSEIAATDSTSPRLLERQRSRPCRPASRACRRTRWCSTSAIRVPSPGCSSAPPRLRRIDKGERSQTVRWRGRPAESDPVAQDLGIHRGGRVGRSAVQPGQGVRQVGGDGQALSIKGPGRRRVGPLQVPALAARASARSRRGCQLGPGGLEVGRFGIDQPAPGFNGRAGGEQPAAGPCCLVGQLDPSRYPPASA